MARVQWTPLGRAAFATLLGSAVAFVATGHPFALAVVALSGGLGVAQMLRMRELAALHCRELAPAWMIEGDARLIDLRFQYPSHSCLPPVKLRLAERSARADEGEISLAGMLGGARAGGEHSTAVHVRALRRGRIQRLSLSMQTAGFFGGWLRREVSTIATDLWVLPHPRELREAVLERMLELRPRGLDRPLPRGPGEGDFYSVREWREGDAERWLHHKLSARRGRKILQVHRGEAPPWVDLVVDLRVQDARAAFQSADFDELLRFAAGIVRSLLARKLPVAMHLMSDQVRLTLAPRCSDLHGFLAPLAVATPCVVPDPGGRVARLPQGLRAGGRKVWIHLGALQQSPSAEWIAIRVGSREYFQLLENRFASAAR